MLLLIVMTAAPVSLFFLDKTADGCAAKVRELPGAKERVLFQTKECPAHVLFDGDRIVTNEGGELRARAADGKVTELGRLPPSDIAELWLEESGAVRATYVSTNVKLVKKKMQFEGKTYDLPVGDAARYPNWGTPAIAVLVELTVGGGTKPLEVKPTKTEAGDTPGTRVLDTPRKPKKGVTSIGELAATTICASSGPLDCSVENELVKKLVVKEEDMGAGVLKIDDKTQLAFPVAFGDSPHAIAPLYLCKDGCKTSTVIEKKPDGKNEMRQLSLAVREGFVLITDEYSGENGRVVDGAGKTVVTLPKTSSGAVFLLRSP